VQISADALQQIARVLLRCNIHKPKQAAGLADASKQAHAGSLMTVFTVPSGLTAITL
jgi:hypothetical protein